MKTIIMKMMMLMPTMINFMKNPMSIMITLMMQIFLSTKMMNMMTKTSWFPFITFLMMIGGLMIIFMYMTSISSNEKFKMKMMMITLMIILMMLPNESLMMENQIDENEKMMNKYTMEKMCSTKMYNKKSLSISMLMMTYLLITMISITKMVKHYEGPLRSSNYE
uniref:NADH dehydrogenase subunit 6 n=1 Tax=Krisna quadrimaculosus TaxID=3041591 RepID=UPI002551EE58|nr:NADH dehydrogenase subunit 6 [Krisna quadrimaculosus]WGG89456.1 NADH dehydrogenase subunit 6 [Krisna quadrimaculosus]